MTAGPRALVLGYGNPGRQDDGLGPAAASAIAEFGWPDVTVCDGYQLNIEDAVDVAEHDFVWFVDAARQGPEPYFIDAVTPENAVEFTSHALRPQAVLAIAQRAWGKSPAAFVMAIRGYEFEFVEALTLGAAANLRAAVGDLAGRIRSQLHGAAQ